MAEQQVGRECFTGVPVGASCWSILLEFGVDFPVLSPSLGPSGFKGAGSLRSDPQKATEAEPGHEVNQEPIFGHRLTSLVEVF